jgi:hypothetical protein
LIETQKKAGRTTTTTTTTTSNMKLRLGPVGNKIPSHDPRIFGPLANLASGQNRGLYF